MDTPSTTPAEVALVPPPPAPESTSVPVLPAHVAVGLTAALLAHEAVQRRLHVVQFLAEVP